MTQVIATRRLWETHDRTALVPDGDVRAHWQASTPGKPVDPFVLKRHGKGAFTAPTRAAEVDDTNLAPPGPGRCDECCKKFKQVRAHQVPTGHRQNATAPEPESKDAPATDAETKDAPAASEAKDAPEPETPASGDEAADSAEGKPDTTLTSERAGVKAAGHADKPGR